MTQTYDAIVIGAGAMGSAAAYYLAKSGQKTLLLEQFRLDHQMGSSYGKSRIIRYAYDYPVYIAMAKAVYPLWNDLEAASGEKLYLKTGGLDFGRPEQPRFAATSRSLKQMEVYFEDLSPAEVAQRFPQFHLDEDMRGIYQPDAGILYVSLCVMTHVRLAQQHGATLMEGTAVQRITPSVDGVTVLTDEGAFSAARLVIAAGSWAKKVLADIELDLPLQPTREQLFFFDDKEVENFQVGRVPIFIGWGDEKVFYGMGDEDGFKCAQHGIHEPTDPDTIKRETDPQQLEVVRGFLRRHMPAVAEKTLVDSRICMYTMTPDEHFVIDRHPLYPHISIGAGFSGHGAKFGTLIGKLLADIASGNPIELDLSQFHLDRFKVK
jgi:monomeric sarcosine oxidase